MGGSRTENPGVTEIVSGGGGGGGKKGLFMKKNSF